MVAFYLPQFYPIPENDLWWEPGYTEWTAVARARPMFPGHRQPRLPTELGYYDLRVPETRAAQAALAKEHGIEGFCYWHYWIGNGKRVLDRPFNEVLRSGEPDFPFCLGWANHDWYDKSTRPWTLLMQQQYPGQGDEAAHFRALEPAFHDPRHLCIDGNPIFLVFRPDLI
ncbi:MAG: glycoside hydrolase family 99-like domain-containing protein, partial [Actinobacteria bacterium]|nr:glycoside hydrolase family 99-like domain-containing protein [Actinomycetota bacterium]